MGGSVSTEHHGWISINSPPHNETSFCFELGVGCEEPILTMGARRDRDSTSGSDNGDLSTLPLTIELSHNPKGKRSGKDA